MSTVFIDSNVVLYLLSGDAAKADRAEAMLNKGGIISVQAVSYTHLTLPTSDLV